MSLQFSRLAALAAIDRPCGLFGHANGTAGERRGRSNLHPLDRRTRRSARQPHDSRLGDRGAPRTRIAVGSCPTPRRGTYSTPARTTASSSTSIKKAATASIRSASSRATSSRRKASPSIRSITSGSRTPTRSRSSPSNAALRRRTSRSTTPDTIRSRSRSIVTARSTPPTRKALPGSLATSPSGRTAARIRPPR